MSERFEVQAVQWDDDGVVTIVYMDREDALRDRGNLWRSQTLSIAPEGSLAPDMDDVLASVRAVLDEATEVFRQLPAFLPTEVEDDEDDDEKGMGW